jgi:hypothetical protein
MNRLRQRVISLEKMADDEKTLNIIIAELRPSTWQQHAVTVAAADDRDLVISLTVHGDELGAPEDYQRYKSEYTAATASSN